MNCLHIVAATLISAISATPLEAGDIEGTWDCKIGSAVKTTITYAGDGSFTSIFSGDGIRQGVRVISAGQASGTWTLTQDNLIENTNHAELTEFKVFGTEKQELDEANAFLDDLIGQTNVSDVLKLNRRQLLLQDARNRVHCKRLQ